MVALAVLGICSMLSLVVVLRSQTLLGREKSGPLTGALRLHASTYNVHIHVTLEIEHAQRYVY